MRYSGLLVTRIALENKYYNCRIYNTHSSFFAYIKYCPAWLGR